MEALVVHLVRHASHDRLGRVLTGRMPGVRLGDRGRSEAGRIAARLGRERVVAVYTGPLERARETAEPIAAAQGLSPQVADGFDEIACGEWTGRPFEGLDADPRFAAWNERRQDGCPPGGEPMRAVQARAVATIEGWRGEHRAGTIAVVSHQDVIKAVICHQLGLSLDRHAAFDVEPASLTTLISWEGGGKLVRLNETVPA